MPTAKGLPICPHCNRLSANPKACTSLGCGKRFDAPVILYSQSKPRGISDQARRRLNENAPRARRAVATRLKPRVRNAWSR